MSRKTSSPNNSTDRKSLLTRAVDEVRYRLKLMTPQEVAEIERAKRWRKFEKLKKSAVGDLDGGYYTSSPYQVLLEARETAKRLEQSESPV